MAAYFGTPPWSARARMAGMGANVSMSRTMQQFAGSTGVAVNPPPDRGPSVKSQLQYRSNFGRRRNVPKQTAPDAIESRAQAVMRPVEGTNAAYP